MINPQSANRVISVGAGIGSLTVVLLWGFETYTGISVPGDVGAAMSTALTFAVQLVLPKQ